MEIQKKFISPEQLRKLSYMLAKEIYTSGWIPKFVVGLWRGAGFITICVDEYLLMKGHKTDCIAIRTSRYEGVDKTREKVEVHNLGYLRERVKEGDRILIVDDVWDAGTTIQAVKKELLSLKAEIRVGVVYYKPRRNKYPNDRPDYFIEESDEWLVFPHELEALSQKEIQSHMGNIDEKEYKSIFE